MMFTMYMCTDVIRMTRSIQEFGPKKKISHTQVGSDVLDPAQVYKMYKKKKEKNYTYLDWVVRVVDVRAGQH